jgi:hypothetical protein
VPCVCLWCMCDTPVHVRLDALQSTSVWRLMCKAGTVRQLGHVHLCGASSVNIHILCSMLHEDVWSRPFAAWLSSAILSCCTAGLWPDRDVCSQLHCSARLLGHAHHQWPLHTLHRAAPGERARCGQTELHAWSNSPAARWCVAASAAVTGVYILSSNLWLCESIREV